MPATFLVCAVIFAFLFGTFPLRWWSWWRGQSRCNLLFPKIETSIWYTQGMVGWQSAFPNFQKSWFVVFVFIASHTFPTMADFQLPIWHRQRVALGREAWNWLCGVDTSPLHQITANRPILICYIPLDTEIGPESSTWSQTMERYHCGELVQTLWGEGHLLSLGIQAVRNM